VAIGDPWGELRQALGRLGDRRIAVSGILVGFAGGVGGVERQAVSLRA